MKRDSSSGKGKDSFDRNRREALKRIAMTGAGTVVAIFSSSCALEPGYGASGGGYNNSGGYTNSGGYGVSGDYLDSGGYGVSGDYTDSGGYGVSGDYLDSRGYGVSGDYLDAG